MLLGLFQECQAGRAGLCSLVGISQVSRIVPAVGDTEQAAQVCADLPFFFLLLLFFFFFFF